MLDEVFHEGPTLCLFLDLCVCGCCCFFIYFFYPGLLQRSLARLIIENHSIDLQKNSLFSLQFMASSKNTWLNSFLVWKDSVFTNRVEASDVALLGSALTQIRQTHYSRNKLIKWKLSKAQREVTMHVRRVG